MARFEAIRLQPILGEDSKQSQELIGAVREHRLIHAAFSYHRGELSLEDYQAVKESLRTPTPKVASGS